jgi:aspartyl-tRNA(Asn)/glutamyl-tRNA(Gln) amidotransferase subunit B
MSTTYKATIGLEVHAELSTKSKMFCGCKNDPHGAVPNSLTCPVCLAHPGTLPVPNEEAIAKVLMFGESVGASRATYSEFDRKNYFYPDIPKAYQISQYAYPFLTGGSLKGVELTRVHLEEDTARSQHEKEGVSLVDFNRAGVPLMELVTEPVIHDSKTAGEFARELQLLLQTLGISDAQMERGEMRVEANISISSTDELGTKVEVKNLNSFRSVESAIDYEIERQRELLESGEAVKQETRGWDEVKQRTFTQRSKETAKDYRYFPDPDIPKINVSEVDNFSTARLNEIMPEIPSKKRIKYQNLGLPSNQIELIISTKAIDNAFLDIFNHYGEGRVKALQLAANYLTTDVLPALVADEQLVVTTESMVELFDMLESSEITSRVAKDLIPELLKDSSIRPKVIAKERGLIQSSDPSALLAVVEEVLSENTSVVDEYLSGKESSIQFLLGQAMKKTRGASNPGVLMQVFKSELEKRKLN